MSLKQNKHCRKCDREFRHIKDIWNGACPQCAQKSDANPVKISINELKSNWPKAEAGINAIGRRWSPLAFMCLTLSRDCSKCPINQTFGWEYPNGNCYMPESVQRLLDDGIKPNRFEMSKVNREILG